MAPRLAVYIWLGKTDAVVPYFPDEKAELCEVKRDQIGETMSQIPKLVGILLQLLLLDHPIQLLGFYAWLIIIIQTK